jgi:hypothetical protein
MDNTEQEQKMQLAAHTHVKLVYAQILPPMLATVTCFPHQHVLICYEMQLCELGFAKCLSLLHDLCYFIVI